MLARARRLDNGELIEGYYFYCEIEKSHFITANDNIEIDPQTIEYKINGNWYSKEDIKEWEKHHKE